MDATNGAPRPSLVKAPATCSGSPVPTYAATSSSVPSAKWTGGRARASARHPPGPGRRPVEGRAERAQRDVDGAGGGGADRVSSTPTRAAISSAVGVPRTTRNTGSSDILSAYGAGRYTLAGVGYGQMVSAPSSPVAERYRLVSPLGSGGMGRVW